MTELNLDNVRTVGEFEGLTEEFVNLEKLSVIKAGLTSFKGFPKLPNLKKVSKIFFTISYCAFNFFCIFENLYLGLIFKKRVLGFQSLIFTSLNLL